MAAAAGRALSTHAAPISTTGRSSAAFSARPSRLALGVGQKIVLYPQQQRKRGNRGRWRGTSVRCWVVIKGEQEAEWRVKREHISNEQRDLDPIITVCTRLHGTFGYTTMSWCCTCFFILTWGSAEKWLYPFVEALLGGDGRRGESIHNSIRATVVGLGYSRSQ